MATRSLGSLTLDVIAKVGGFVSGMSQAARSAESNTRKIRKNISDLAKVAGAGFVAAAGAVAAWTASTVNAAYEIDRLSTLANTSNQTFQRWALAASTVGIEQQKLADILKDTQDKVGDFIQTGGGALADFFENIAPKVGVTADQFRRLSGPDALQLYVSSLEKANLSQSDLVFYLEAIASDSSLLLPLLRDNGRALGEFGDKAEALGAILNQETIDAAKQAKIQFDQFGLALNGIKNRIVAEVLPNLISLQKELFGTVEDTAKLSEISEVASTGMKLLGVTGVVVAGVFKSVGQAIGGAALVLQQLITFDPGAAFQTAQSVFADFNNNLKETGASAVRVWDGVTDEIERPIQPEIKPLSPAFSKDAKNVKSEAEKLREQIQDILDGISYELATFGLTRSEKTIFDLAALGASEAQINVAKLELATIDWLDATLEGMEEIERYEEERNERFRDVISSLEEEIALMGMTIEQQEIYNNLKYAGVSADSERGRQIIAQTEALQRQREEIALQVEAMDSVRDAARGFIVDITSGAKSFKDAFIDAFDSIAAKLIEIAAQKLVEQAFGQQGSTSGGQYGGFVSSIASAIFGGGRASGGSVRANTLYEVNEYGTEMFSQGGRDYLLTGSKGGFVTPAGGTRGGSLNQTVNIQVSGRLDRRTEEQLARSVGRESQRGLARTGA